MVTFDEVTETRVAGGMNTATFEHYIDFAREHAIPYVLLDGGWYGPIQKPESDITRPVPELDLPHLLRYAEERGIRLLLWVHQADARESRRLENAFACYEQWGIRGVKVDFFDRDDQETVQFVRRVVETAARHHLMLDLHGIYKPTGVERTFPNLMTHEGVQGAEYNIFSHAVSPRHNVTLPYTRMLAGPMDYTPGAFRSRRPDTWKLRSLAPLVLGSRCHQLAMYVVYESGLQMVSDYPDAIRGQVGADLLRIVPVAWDETRFLEGTPGEWAVLARRRGRDWWLGAMTNEQERTLSLPLASLLPGKTTYQATIWADAPDADQDPNAALVRQQTVQAGDILHAQLASGGGWVAHLTPTP